MLVATPGQTASFHPTLHGSSGSAPKKICHTSSSSALATSTSSIINKLPAESSSAGNSSNTNSLMKTLSVRLNRGTEFLKGTVQKALISTTANINTTAANSSGHGNTFTSAAAANLAVNASNNAANNSTTSANGAGATAASRIAAAAAAASFLKLYTVPPTATHRHPEERLRTSSVDSLHKEMCHFKPIRSAPTTPWKCGSKSRGASLKIPKANLATKDDMHLNCDEPALSGGALEDAEGKMGAESRTGSRKLLEPNAYKHLLPKQSSSLLTNTISTPTHQSAFVCLVAEMKNLTTQHKRKSTVKKHKANKGRGRAKAAGKSKKTANNNNNGPASGESTRKRLLLRKRKNPFVNVKKLLLPADLIMNKGICSVHRESAEKAVAQPQAPLPKGAKSKNNNKSNKNQNQSVTKPKSKNSLQKTSTNLIHIVQLAHEQKMNQNNAANTAGAAGDGASTGKLSASRKGAAATETKRRGRKRKFYYDLTELEEESAQPTKRKSARISKDCSNGATSNSTTSAAKQKSSRTASNKSSATARFTPPLTRSRLKQMSHAKLLAALDYRHRNI